MTITNTSRELLDVIKEYLDMNFLHFQESDLPAKSHMQSRLTNLNLRGLASNSNKREEKIEEG